MADPEISPTRELANLNVKTLELVNDVFARLVVERTVTNLLVAALARQGLVPSDLFESLRDIPSEDLPGDQLAPFAKLMSERADVLKGLVEGKKGAGNVAS